MISLRRAFLACACLFLLPAAALAETRLGLVISQTDYTGDLSRVASASQEADTIASALIDTGFDVTRAHDLNKRDLAATLNAFRRKVDMAGPDAVAFVYYTGHGAQHPESGDSYLLGVDAELVAASDLAFYGLDMQPQRDGFAATGARAIFLVFDACRNVPGFSGYKAGVKGLSRVEARPDMLIAYATGLDDVAKEGVYAPVLAEEIRRPGQKAEDAFAAAQRRVAGRTNRSQLPWTNNLLYNEFCFAACEKPAVTERPEPFELVMSGSDLDQAFLTVYGEYDKAVVRNEANETFDVTPAFAVQFDDYIALVSKAQNREDAHVATGYSAAHYIKDGQVIGEWPDLGVGNGFGMPPDYSLRTGLLNYPTMMVQAGYSGQGQTIEWQTLIEITPDGPQTRAEVTTLDDTTGAAYGDLKPCVLEGKIKPSRTGADSFQVDYKFTSEIKGEDRLVTYTLDPASGTYVPDFEYGPEVCASLMFDAAEGGTE
jgi:hypothetical protein